MDAEGKIYLDDLKVGDEMMSPGRTITESDIVLFAGLTGDWNPLHTDKEFAATTQFGKRIAHGALGFSIHSGLLTRITDFRRIVAIAVMGFKEWQYRAPLFIHDTVRLRIRVEGIRESRKKDRGVLTLKRELINQKDEIVQEGMSDMLIMRRPV